MFSPRAVVRGLLGAVRVGAVAPSREMGRRGGALYGAGVVIVLVTLLLPGSTAVIPVVAGVLVAAASSATLLWFLGHRIPPSAYALFTALGTVLIAILARWGESGGIAYSFLYVWATLFAFHFYRLGHALLQTALIAGAVIVLGPGSPAERLLIIGSVGVAGVWTQLAVVQVRSLARTDSVTTLHNRRAWDEELVRAVARSGRGRAPLCLAILDIDHFKVFNDEQGHRAGDLVLQALATSWRAALRTDDYLARCGGEEFGVLLPGVSLQEALNVVERLRQLVPRGLTCSAGIAALAQGESPAALMTRADAALYDAKVRGRNQAVIAPGPAESGGTGWLAHSTRWVATVLHTVENGRVNAVFQPVVRLGDTSVLGYEALARPMQPPIQGSVEGFFAAAQRMGVTRELDYICRRAAIESAQVLPPETLLFLNMSVAALLDREHAPDQLQLLLEASGSTARRIVIEISERETITDVERLRHRVTDYRDAGFRFAVDDAGEGHSTFEVLAAVMPEYVKLAMTFTRAIDRPGPRAAVGALLHFAEKSGADVIAEGIEDAATVEALLEVGVTLGQGYHLGRPQPVEVHLRELLRTPDEPSSGGARLPAL